MGDTSGVNGGSEGGNGDNDEANEDGGNETNERRRDSDGAGDSRLLRSVLT